MFIYSRNRLNQKYISKEYYIALADNWQHLNCYDLSILYFFFALSVKNIVNDFAKKMINYGLIFCYLPYKTNFDNGLVHYISNISTLEILQR